MLFFFLIPQIILINSQNSYYLKISEDFNQISECISNSEYIYRVKYKHCYKRTNWFDYCGVERQQNTWIKYNPITGIYNVFKDIRNDKTPERIKNFDNLDDAISDVRTTEVLKFNPKKNRKNYISVSFSSECKNTRTIDNALLRIISFGIFSAKTTISEWVDIDI